MKILYFKFVAFLSNLYNLPLLAMRLILAYGFYSPAKMKLENMPDIISWFEGMGFTFQTLNAYLAAYSEAAGVVLLTLGLATRLISIPLMADMVVAITKVHGANGFEAANNGFEIPLYYIIMLFSLFIMGPGKASIDYIVFRKLNIDNNLNKSLMYK
jgi:putative oxidoreductase